MAKNYTKKVNPEYVQEQKSLASKRAMRWAKENPEKNAESQKKFRENHPEVSREHKRRRRARKHENGYEKYLEQQVLETYGVICHVCFEEIDLEAPRQVGLQGWQKGFHIDHLVPISKGGPDTLENVRPAHGICNLKKSHFYSDLD